MIYTDTDLIRLFTIYRDVEKYVGIRVKKIKSNSRDYLIKNGLDIDEILSSRYIPGRISNEMRRKTELDFHIEGTIGDYIINLFIFNRKEYRDTSSASLSSYKASEEDEYGSVYTISSSSKSSRFATSTTDSSIETRGGAGRVGKQKKVKNLNMKEFAKMEVSEGLYGSNIINMLTDGLAFVQSCRTPRHQYSVILYASPKPKEMPSVKRYQAEFIVEDDINSGMTIVNMNASKRAISAVVRLEEIGKVFIHELVHASLVDIKYFGYFSSDLMPLEEKIRKDLRISQATPLAIGEASTEVLAEQIYLCCLSFRIPSKLYSNVDAKQFPIDTLRRLVEREVEFCELQILKILYFYGFRYVKDFLKKYKFDVNMPKLASPTNVFGYIFLRYGLLVKFMRETLDGFVGEPINPSIYQLVSEKRIKIKEYYQNGYKRLYFFLENLVEVDILSTVLDRERKFPYVGETSLRFLSCEDIECFR